MPSLVFPSPVIAHRGASAEAPENTMAALKKAQEAGAQWIEFDVKLSQDGTPILMHDDTLERTTDGTGYVADTDWDDIQKLDAGGWFHERFWGQAVPTMAEALAFILENNLRVNLEIKPCRGRTRATAMVTLIEAVKIWQNDTVPPLISSFDEEALAISAQLQPSWPRSFAFEDWRGDWHEAARRVDAEALTVDEKLLSGEYLRALVKSNLHVLAYTVNDPARARGLLNEGVSAIFCDDPKAMLAAL